MKRILNIILASITFASQMSFAWNGFFFNVSNNNNILSIRTVIPNHTYPEAGIKVNTPGYAIANPGVDCYPISNGYCLFTVSDKTLKNISISGPPGKFNIRLCLNGVGPLSCQDFDISDSTLPCNNGSGKLVVGSNACWTIQTVSDPSTILRCSDVCNAAGSTLQNPGPTNSATLAGNVCSAFGFTESPQKTSPGTLTFIGQAFETKSCVWDNLTNTNWNNPNNSDFSGATGHYICPCIKNNNI